MSRCIVNELTRVLGAHVAFDAEPQGPDVAGRGRIPIKLLAWQYRSREFSPGFCSLTPRLVLLPVHYTRGEEIMNSRNTIWAMEQTIVEWEERLLSVRRDNSWKQQPFILRVQN